MRDMEVSDAGWLEAGCLEAGFPKLDSGCQIRKMALEIRHQRRLLGQDVLYVGRVGETIAT